MNTSSFVRDAKRVYQALAHTETSLIAKEDIRIYIPTRYVDSKLAYIGVETYTVGIYMMATSDNRYAISLIPAMIPISPTTHETVEFNHQKYYEFTFRAGSVIISNLNLVKDNKLIYTIFKEMVSNGKTPWYIGYLDFARLFSMAPKYAGVSIGENHEVMELLTSMLARSPLDKTQSYRQTAVSIEDSIKNPPHLIPLRSVQYAATNTTTKLAGSYFRPALISAILNPSTRLERVESILLK